MRLRGDDGSVAPMVPILVLAFLILGGLVIDGGRDLNARGEAQAYAEEAARAGATAVDLTKPTLELVKAGDDDAQRRVAKYCAAVMSANPAVKRCRINPTTPFSTDETCATNGTTGRASIVVNTEVTVRIDTTLMKIVGVTGLDAAGAGKARPYEGTSAKDAC